LTVIKHGTLTESQSEIYRPIKKNITGVTSCSFFISVITHAHTCARARCPVSPIA